ncbi:SPX domain-containing protein, partial [Cardiosporidium cionae]
FFPFKDITLAQNLVGDVFTSLSKPMGDVQRTVCYFWNGTLRSTCPSVDPWVRPLVFGFPYYLRFMQLFGRYRGDREGIKRKIHLANMVRYIAGMAVIACTSIRWQGELWRLHLHQPFDLGDLIYLCYVVYGYLGRIYRLEFNARSRSFYTVTLLMGRCLNFI